MARKKVGIEPEKAAEKTFRETMTEMQERFIKLIFGRRHEPDTEKAEAKAIEAFERDAANYEKVVKH